MKKVQNLKTLVVQEFDNFAFFVFYSLAVRHKLSCLSMQKRKMI